MSWKRDGVKVGCYEKTSDCGIETSLYLTTASRPQRVAMKRLPIAELKPLNEFLFGSIPSVAIRRLPIAELKQKPRPANLIFFLHACSSSSGGRY